ncbi:general stress protein [Nitratifractor salsuginis]|uniref:General stress protein 17M-like domain-containing protein n=1 Tax=Nitratifractor salsuginis (strain DSM 16511 / JCM 12458 / E9I37-1) TaxID=749222 RepID=E6X2G5_NITSE|nr:general stress protein [Nitratifractor salsuginis]ADV47170.1 hypothetical protein Nitsa_1926 [Nitratifractor salsuginis DSM 16511]
MTHHFAVGVFNNIEEADKAVRTLIKEGVDKHQISIIGKTNEEKVDEEVRSKVEADVFFWGAQGGLWGGLLGLLVGGALFVIPGIGPIAGAGTIAGSLAGLVGGAVAGATALGLVDGLVEWGLSREKAEHYKDLVEQGKVIVFVKGNVQETADAGETLRSLSAEEVEVK